MAGDAPRVILMREGANRAIGYALLASLLLHALALATLPSLRGLAAPLPPEPEPLIARVEQRAPPPSPRAPEPVRPSPKPPAPRAKLAPRQPAPLPAMKATPAPAPPTVAAPQSAPAPAPAPAPDPSPAPVPEPPVTVAPPAPEALPPATRPVPVPTPAEMALQRYQRGVIDAAARFKRYPRAAIDNGWQGEVVAKMTIGADGRIAYLSVKTSSGYPALDRQALEMFRNAKLLVSIPRELRGREFALDLRAMYDLRDAR